MNTSDRPAKFKVRDICINLVSFFCVSLNDFTESLIAFLVLFNFICLIFSPCRICILTKNMKNCWKQANTRWVIIVWENSKKVNASKKVDGIEYSSFSLAALGAFLSMLLRSQATRREVSKSGRTMANGRRSDYRAEWVSCSWRVSATRSSRLLFDSC